MDKVTSIYDETGGGVQQGSDGDRSLYVTRGDGVVYLNHRTGESTGMWRCDIPDSNGIQKSIYIYLGTPNSGTVLNCAYKPLLILLVYIKTGQLKWTQRLIRILLSPKFTVTCQNKGGPATAVVWMRDKVRVEEDSNHSTSQIIVYTSGNTVYNKLRVRGREGRRYH